MTERRLYELTQVSEIYVDAMVRDVQGDLMFMSCYGRDTAIKELMARIQIQGQQGAISELTVKAIDQNGQSRLATATLLQPKELEHHTGRLPRGLFGQLIHTWIYNPIILGVNKGAKQAWVIQSEPRIDSEAQALGAIREQVWDAVKQLASVPLLDHWREPVLDSIWADMVFECGVTQHTDYSPRLSIPIGPIRACCIRLADEFPNRVTQLIRRGVLQLEPPQSTPARLALPYSAPLLEMAS
jgi:hypothetical protein